MIFNLRSNVATVPTACGIETLLSKNVLKATLSFALQQYLPLAVLKQANSSANALRKSRCNSTYRLRY